MNLNPYESPGVATASTRPLERRQIRLLVLIVFTILLWITIEAITFALTGEHFPPLRNLLKQNFR
ncbi:hypothetical protein [Anatilimnocola aggregata]|nr:hypothetical protein [Anatilimnocola aggregata]